MKIKEFLISEYGPLNNQTPFKLSNFNLFWGKNERGKSLTIDALVKLLIGKKKTNLKGFQKIDRVGETPDGYIEMEVDKNTVIELSSYNNKKNNINITSSEFRNIFSLSRYRQTLIVKS